MTLRDPFFEVLFRGGSREPRVMLTDGFEVPGEGFIYGGVAPLLLKGTLEP